MLVCQYFAMFVSVGKHERNIDRTSLFVLIFVQFCAEPLCAKQCERKYHIFFMMIKRKRAIKIRAKIFKQGIYQAGHFSCNLHIPGVFFIGSLH